jgi:hypothetical protein
MRFCFELLAATLALPRVAHALTVEDAGTLDFLVATAGHGVTRFAKPYEGSILTTDAPSSSDKPTSCYVASRKIEDGSLLWRRNVCATPSKDQNHAIATNSAGDYFYTMDRSGIVRAWTMRDGTLVWDAKVAATTGQPRVWTFTKAEKDYVAVASDEDFTILEADTGK